MPYHAMGINGKSSKEGEFKTPEIYQFDSDGNPVDHGKLDLTTLLNMGVIISEKDDGDEAEIDKKKENESSALGDSLSILRFLRGNKSKRLEISPSGKCLWEISKKLFFVSEDRRYILYIIFRVDLEVPQN